MSRQPKQRWQVVSHRNGQTHVLAVTRRLPGALNIRDEHVENTTAKLRKHARPSDRVISGPTGRDHEVAVVAIGRDLEYEIRFAVEPTITEQET